MNLIEKLYWEVIKGNRYDLDGAAQHNDELKALKVSAKDMPEAEAYFLKTNHFGCCLHYAMALYKALRDEQVKCFIAITLEENPETKKMTDMHVSVCYTKGGKRYIADPVESVKRGGKGQYFEIPIDYYGLTNGTIWLFDPYGEHGDELFFEDFLCHPMEIIKAD